MYSTVLSRREMVFGVCAIATAGAAPTLKADPVNPCDLNVENEVTVATSFSSANAADAAVREICEAVGLPQNFRIIAVSHPDVNACAKVEKSTRYLIYQRDFMRSVGDKDSRNWPGLTIMAHEIGHHLCGHTLDKVGSQPAQELEADHFAGFAVGRLNGTLKNAEEAFLQLPEKGTETHPARRERLAAVGAGWKKANREIAVKEETQNLITHNKRPDGSYARLIVQFVGKNGEWIEYQKGNLTAKFKELARDHQSIYLYDDPRKIWVRIDPSRTAGIATGYWAWKVAADEIPTTWFPLDPLQWR